MNHKGIEPVDWLLFFAVLFFALLLIGVSKWSPDDGQTFQVISGLVTGFAGALFTRIKGTDGKSKSPDPTEAEKP